MIQEETTTTKEMLEHHFDDDKISFAKIDKRFEKHEELMMINGEHLSYLNKNLVEQNDKIDDLAVSLEEIKKTLDAMKGMKKDYDNKQGFKSVIKENYILIISIATLIGAFLTINSVF